MTLGKYTIRVGLRRDNPAFPQYQIFKNGHLVGVQFSMPCLSDCQWHEHQRGEYAKPTNRPEGYSAHQVWRRGRLTNAERAKRDETLLDVPVEEAA